MTADFYMGKWQVFTDDCHVFDGKRKLKLEPKAMDLLVVLAKADGLLVSREEIFTQVWENQIIADHVLYKLITNLRKILEDNPHKPEYIVTVPKKGYRLGQPIRLPDVADSPRSKILSMRTLANIVAGIIIFGVMAYWINKP